MAAIASVVDARPGGINVTSPWTSLLSVDYLAGLGPEAFTQATDAGASAIRVGLRVGNLDLSLQRERLGDLGQLDLHALVAALALQVKILRQVLINKGLL